MLKRIMLVILLLCALVAAQQPWQPQITQQDVLAALGAATLELGAARGEIARLQGALAAAEKRCPPLGAKTPPPDKPAAPK